MRQLRRMLLRALPDEAYVRLLYLKTHGHFLHLRRPRTFDEKLQWYKLYHRDPLMTTLSDKYEVRKYLMAAGHGGLLNELYGVYDRVEEIDLAALPRRFVLKATHGSDMNIICRDKRALDWDAARARMRRWLQTNYFRTGRQWAYRDIRPRLVCEKFLENDEFGELLDFKFYCYGGKPEVLFVCTGRYGAGGVKYNAYDMKWNRILAYKGRPASHMAIEKPENFSAMVDVARELCSDFPFIRVDLYSIKKKLLFGEFTFYPDNGTVPFTPDEYNYFFGDLFILPDRGCRSKRP
jgi:hypothetical protein